MRVLVTGVTGFIGRSLAVRLVGEGYSVYGLARFVSTGRRVPDGVQLVVGDLVDYHSISRVVEAVRPHIVFHLAAMTPVSESYTQPRAYAEVNYIGTVNLLEALRRHGYESLRLVAVAGTTEMYDTNGMIGDGVMFKPESPYAVSKVAAVLYSEYMYKAYRVPVVIVVPTNTYGRAYVGQKHFFIEKLITNMLIGVNRIKLGNPHAIRDWMYREDHVDAYISVMKAVLDGREGVLGERFYFGTGKGYTTRETAELIRKLTGWSGELEWGAFIRPAETAKIVVDNSKAIKRLGWRPRHSLEEGLRKAINEWREVLGL